MESLSTIQYCRECRVSHHLAIKDLKNAFIEKPANLLRGMPAKEMEILEDYAWKSVLKAPEDIVSLSRMATEIKKEWKPARVLSVSFIGGNKVVKERLMAHAKTWMDHANIEFDFTPRKKPGDIRISFRKSSGSWSCVGTEAMSIDKTEPTMNFGWLEPMLEDDEFSRVVLHEFGHALGCIHEHERPDNGIPWDKPKVYRYYAKTNDWSPEEVDTQVFSKYDRSQIRMNKTDKDSIMMYAVPEQLTIGNFKIGWNTVLSEADKLFIANVYPR